MKLTKTQRNVLQFIANAPGQVPARTAARTFKALTDNGFITRNESGDLIVTAAGRTYLTGGFLVQHSPFNIQHLPFNRPTPWNVSHPCLGSNSFDTEDAAHKFMARAVKREQDNPHPCAHRNHEINAVRQAETASQTYMRTVEESDWSMTPRRIAAREAFKAAIAAAYPAMNADSIYNCWDAYETKTVAEAAAIAEQIAKDDEMDA